LPGGHCGPLKNRFVRTKDGFSFSAHRRVNWPLKNYQPLLAKAGDVIVLHGFLPHFSEQNRSNKTRFAYTLHFIDRRCHYEKNNWLDISQNTPNIQLKTRA
jgi:phytanoyl-CoA hydroxylase